MIVLIGFYNGSTAISTVIAVVGANVAMIFFGWLQELMNPPGRASTTMLPFWFGTVAGAAPWVVILVNLVGAAQDSAGAVPGFVFGIVFSLLVFFSSFAVNQWLQYQRGRPAGAATPSASARTSCSAWSRSPPWRGRSSVGLWRAEPARGIPGRPGVPAPVGGCKGRQVQDAPDQSGLDRLAGVTCATADDARAPTPRP